MTDHDRPADDWTQTDELSARFMAALIVANPETTDTYFLVRVAFKCADVFEAERQRRKGAGE